MEYQLQLKPFAGRKEGFKYMILQITDFALHTRTMRSTKNVGQKIEESIENHAPGRIYMSKQDGLKNGLVDFNALNKNLDLVRFIQEQEKQGVKILLHFPKSGVPIIAGKDTVEFIESTRGRRVLRRLKKKQTQL
jgi:hypothetical protein